MGMRGKHVNVLQHLMGYLKNHISGEDKSGCKLDLYTGRPRHLMYPPTIP
jgi:uncharacterized protein YbgA (DUF1722 family)